LCFSSTQALSFGFPPFFFLEQAKMAEDLMRKKVILKRAVQELHQKLETAEEGRAAAEERQH
jgi:hypothetical protein